MNVLLSIKPKYVESIMNGEKQYEFRKAIFKRKNLDKIFIYSSTPVKKIVGFFIIGEIIEDSPKILWKKCNGNSGLTETEFFEYFKGKRTGYAIGIKKVEIFDIPLDPKEISSSFIPPQSFQYIDEFPIKKDKNKQSP